MSRTRSLRTPSNRLLLSLICADVTLMTNGHMVFAQGAFAGGRPLMGVAGESTLKIIFHFQFSLHYVKGKKYCVHMTAWSIIIRGSDPEFGKGVGC